jgi:lipid II:glycine glycyltransferase (peptidoglycan interpeptide bridge formation enzyme)
MQVMSSIEFRPILQSEPFDPLTISADAPFTQARLYGEWQENLGRTTFRFVGEKNGKAVAYIQLTEYPLIKDRKYLYAPYGPVVSEFSNEILEAVKEKMMAVARERNAVFIRLDFTPAARDQNKIAQLDKHFKRAPSYTYHSAYFQPRAEWVLNLHKTEEDIYKEIHEKNRYSIRLAGRKGVTTEIITSDFARYFPDFYKLMKETSDRNGFSLHEKEYYENIFNTLKPEYAYLVLAKFEGAILTVDLIIYHGKVANYVFAGSSDEHRNLGITHIAQWEAIKHAKKIGCTEYNFGGVSLGNLYKGWEGLTRFKTRFGGHELIHSDFYDVVAQPLWYYLYNLRKLIKRFI